VGKYNPSRERTPEWLHYMKKKITIKHAETLTKYIIKVAHMN
jgi:hypothetical protein